MKKLWMKTVPVLVALLLLVTPEASVLAAEDALSQPSVSAATIVAKVAEETPTDQTGTADTSASDASSSDAASAEAAVPDENFNHVWPTPPEIDTESVLVIENSTSAVLYEKEADTMRYPASTTKILTALITIENCSLDEIVTFSESAVTLEAGATNIKAQAGEQMPLKDVLYGLMLPSGNDCANALAEHVAGSVSAFADMMNAKAAELGCTASHFSNPHGLFAQDHYTTARDLSIIAQAAFNNSTFVDIISTPVYYAAETNMSGERTFNNSNLLLDEDSDYYDPDVIGGKTGYLDEAGRCLVTFARRDGFTVITIQLKGGYTQIFGEAKLLSNFAFENFTMQNVAANERRFSYAVPDAKVVIDPAAQILSLRAIPFEQLESEITFADKLSVERKAELQLSPTTDSARTLYAVIDYAYAGHDLGSVNIYIDPELELLPAAFTSVQYIPPLYLVIFIILILVLAISFYGTGKNKKKAAAAQQRRSVPSEYRNTEVPRPQSRDTGEGRRSVPPEYRNSDSQRSRYRDGRR